MIYLEDKESLIKKGINCLLEIKDSDIRLLSLYQCRYAVDGGIHIGGAFSATIPMVSLFYGGIINLNIGQPTAPEQDMFVLSKGHAVATLASIYADLGYFDKEILKNSRSISSVLNGHPGPLLPGVHLATGPMGQGMGVAQGFAIAGQKTPKFDVYVVTGDGELQEGPIWEAIMYSGFKNLENLCVMVDNNGGQLDNVSKLHFPYNDLGGSFGSFGWRVITVDATKYHTVYNALLEFKYGKRDGRPTVIICKTTKGYGGFSNVTDNHKTNISEVVLDQEVLLQEHQRERRGKVFSEFVNSLMKSGVHSDIITILQQHADNMGFNMVIDDDNLVHIRNMPMSVKTQKAPDRIKQIHYSHSSLPVLEKGKSYLAHKVIESAMQVFARDEHIVSVDSDLASTSGLQAGVGFVDKSRSLNVGVAEANMMLIGEAYAILGYNVWISTFCPFFDWKILRRIAVGYQERLEVIADKGWLSKGHGLDLTMVATAADLDTQSNGATHMGNDDVTLLNEAAHVKILNVSCPQQLLSTMKWILAGDKGIVYLRILRSPAPVIYDADFVFEFGKAYAVNDQKPDAVAYIVATGREVHEAMEAADILSTKDVAINVIDMPSIDEDAILDLYRTGKPIFIVEQNNGYLWTNFRKVLFAKESFIDTQNLFPINLTNSDGIHYVHSGTYSELVSHYGLNATRLSEKILKTLKK
ncbi:MAG TPA: transketolase C-terminal domain-containing protein [Hanamia sp.]